MDHPEHAVAARGVGARSRGNVETLERLMAEHDMFAAIPGHDSLTIDLGVVSADQAAEQIAAHLAR